jgi:hypothetical protein
MSWKSDGRVPTCQHVNSWHGGGNMSCHMAVEHELPWRPNCSGSMRYHGSGNMSDHGGQAAMESSCLALLRFYHFCVCVWKELVRSLAWFHGNKYRILFVCLPTSFASAEFSSSFDNASDSACGWRPHRCMRDTIACTSKHSHIELFRR